MLLFWPCSWGLAFSASLNQNFDKLIYFLILFFFGSVLMRSAGCIFNDIVDKVGEPIKPEVEPLRMPKYDLSKYGITDE